MDKPKATPKTTKKTTVKDLPPDHTHEHVKGGASPCCGSKIRSS